MQFKTWIRSDKSLTETEKNRGLLDPGPWTDRIKVGRSAPNEITIFDSTGLAIQDAMTAEFVYRKALEKKIGKVVQL